MVNHTKSINKGNIIMYTLESEVRTYSRSLPGKFVKAKDSLLYDEDNNSWIDFLSGAGSLNYGHNPSELVNPLLDYIKDNGVVNSLDLWTKARFDFLQTFHRKILAPRELDYKIQFCGPTGTNSVESALKLAKKCTQRNGVISFSNSYHGMTCAAMSSSASFNKRKESYLTPTWISFMPFDGFLENVDSLEFTRQMLTKKGSGISPPAAFIIELVQGEGGVNIATKKWVQGIASLAKDLGSVLIIDEIQSGCGRTGKFFSFEHFDIKPDMVCVSKSISGLGLPMSLLLISPELDIWSPGEHNGTFRGFNYAFITATAAINSYWDNKNFLKQVDCNISILENELSVLQSKFKDDLIVRNLGMFAGIEFYNKEYTKKIQKEAFDNGLLIEICGPSSNVIKLLPSINMSSSILKNGLDILTKSIESICVLSFNE